MKNVLVTGASKGIGLCIAQKFKDNGFKVFICSRNADKLNELTEKYGFGGFFACDLTEQGSCKKLVNSVGQIDILINNAGGYVCKSIEETEESEIDDLIKLNVKAPFELSKLCIPNMKKNKFGRIINIGSVSGVVGEAYASLYSMTKSSYFGFSKALALEVASFGITVNTINPGWVKTDMTENDALSREEILDIVPQKRFVEPCEIADLCLYLASEKARGITGQSISVCAGISAG